MEMEIGIFLLLGTNQGDRMENLSRAKDIIELRLGTIVDASSVYKTAAWGKQDQNEFYNQVIELKTDFNPDVLMEQILIVENDLGRIRTEKWGPRIIDIDILFYNDKIVNKSNLIIPHPGIPQRKFTLVPLNEMISKGIHPVLKITMEKLLQECTDTLDVVRVVE